MMPQGTPAKSCSAFWQRRAFSRWPSRVPTRPSRSVAAAHSSAADEERPEAEADPFADLVAELADFRRGVSRPGRISLAGTMLQATTGREAAERYRARVVAPRRARLRAILDANDMGEAEIPAGLAVG